MHYPQIRPKRVGDRIHPARGLCAPIAPSIQITVAVREASRLVRQSCSDGGSAPALWRFRGATFDCRAYAFLNSQEHPGPGFSASVHSKPRSSKAAEGRRTPGRCRDFIRSRLPETISQNTPAKNGRKSFVAHPADKGASGHCRRERGHQAASVYERLVARRLAGGFPDAEAVLAVRDRAPGDGRSGASASRPHAPAAIQKQTLNIESWIFPEIWTLSPAVSLPDPGHP